MCLQLAAHVIGAGTIIVKQYSSIQTGSSLIMNYVTEKQGKISSAYVLATKRRMSYIFTDNLCGRHNIF